MLSEKKKKKKKKTLVDSVLKDFSRGLSHPATPSLMSLPSPLRARSSDITVKGLGLLMGIRPKPCAATKSPYSVANSHSLEFPK